MKILVGTGLVNDRKEGKWHYYSVNHETMTEYCEFIRSICNYMDSKCSGEEKS